MYFEMYNTLPLNCASDIRTVTSFEVVGSHSIHPSKNIEDCLGDAKDLPSLTDLIVAVTKGSLSSHQRWLSYSQEQCLTSTTFQELLTYCLLVRREALSNIPIIKGRPIS